MSPIVGELRAVWLLVLGCCVVGLQAADVPNPSPKPAAKPYNPRDVRVVSDSKLLKLLHKFDSVLLLLHPTEIEESDAATKMAFYTAATQFKGDDRAFAAVDYTTQKRAAKIYGPKEGKGVRVIHFKRGEFNVEYDFDMTAMKIGGFMDNVIGSSKQTMAFSVSDVFQLTRRNFQSFMKEHPSGVLIDYHADWCSHCQDMKPAFMEAARKLKAEGYTDVVLAAVNCQDGETLCSDNKYLPNFPSLKFWKNGSYQFDYHGSHTAEEFYAYAKNPTKAKPEVGWEDEPGNVVHLTDETFDAHMKEYSSVLAVFYAPWCGHCKRLHPELNTASETLAYGALAAIDCTKYQPLAKRFNVSGFPSIKYFEDGMEHPSNTFQQPRTADGIISFMNDPTAAPPPPPEPEVPWSSEVSAVRHLTDKSFKKFLKASPSTLVMFYAPWCGHCKAMKGDYTKAAGDLQGVSDLAAVDATQHPKAAKKWGVKGYPSLKFFRHGKFVSEYDQQRKRSAIVDWVIAQEESTLGL